MTYKHLKSFIELNNTAFTGKIFDLIPKGIKSKIIFAVGSRASEASAYFRENKKCSQMTAFFYANSINFRQSSV